MQAQSCQMCGIVVLQHNALQQPACVQEVPLSPLKTQTIERKRTKKINKKMENSGEMAQPETVMSPVLLLLYPSTNAEKYILCPLGKQVPCYSQQRRYYTI